VWNGQEKGEWSGGQMGEFGGIMEQPPHSSAGLGGDDDPVLSGELIL